MTRLQPTEFTLGQRFRVASLLGQSDLAELYEVRESASGQPFLLQVITTQAASNASTWAECERQVQASAGLRDGAFVRPIQVGTDDSVGRFILCDAISGTSLAAQVASSTLLPDRVSAILDALAPAFDQATDLGLRHGGLHPGNLFVSPKGAVTIAEFGLASLRLAWPSPWTGILGWAAPEQAQGIQWARNTDVYGLALLAYFALTGRSYFSSLARGGPADPNALWAEMVAPPAPRTGLDPNLDRALARALSPDPATRTATVTAFASEFRGAVMLAIPTVVAPQPLQKGLGGTIVMKAGEGIPNIAEILSRASAASAASAASGPLSPTQPVDGSSLSQPYSAAGQAGIGRPASGSGLAEPASSGPLSPIHPTPILAVSGAQSGPSQSSVAQATIAQSAIAQSAAGQMMPRQPAPAQVPMGTQLIPPHLIPVQQSAPQPHQQPYPSMPPVAPSVPPKKGNGLLLVAGLLGALSVLALGGAAGGYYYWRSLQVAGPTPVPTASPTGSPAAAVADPPAMTASAPGGTEAASPTASNSSTAPQGSSSTAPGAPSASAAPPADAVVAFECKPACGAILCDGVDVGTSHGDVHLTAGEHQCEASKAGYVTRQETITAVAGKRTAVRLELKKEPKPAEPTGATSGSTSGGTGTTKPATKPPKCGTFINPCKKP